MGRMGMPVQKARDRKGTLKRLISYFKAERKFVLLLALTVIVGVAMGVIAPRFQANAIDRIKKPELGPLGTMLVLMLVAYVLYGLSTL